jgi:hypothetical protein
MGVYSVYPIPYTVYRIPYTVYRIVQYREIMSQYFHRNLLNLTVVIRHNCHVSTWVPIRISTWKSRRSVNERLLTTVLCAAHWHVHLGRWQASICYDMSKPVSETFHWCHFKGNGKVMWGRRRTFKLYLQPFSRYLAI